MAAAGKACCSKGPESGRRSVRRGTLRASTERYGHQRVAGQKEGAGFI